MDHHLHENAKKWLKRAKRYHAADAANRDPYTAYFSYFIALLILAKEHDNNLPPSKKADSEEKMFRNLFRDFFEEILSALDTPSLRPVTHELAGRLSQIHPGSDQAIIFISPFEQASLGEERRNKIKESRDRAIKDMKALASYWAGREYEAKPEDLSKFVFTFFWQVRNNLFHGEKGYGTAGRISEDSKLLDKACRLLDAVVEHLLTQN